MKKTSLFFILIFSVFFSYHTAFAFTRTQQTPTVSFSSGTYHITNFSGTNYVALNGYQSWKYCQGTDYGTCYTSLATSGGISGDSIVWWSTHNFGTGAGISPAFTSYGANPTTDGNYYLEVWDGASQYTGNSEYYEFVLSAGGTVWNGVGTIPPDGIASQLTPVASSSVPYTVNFTGTYNNYYGDERVIIATAHNTTGTAIYSSVSATVSSGLGVSYSLNLLLSPNMGYDYTMTMCDASGVTCTTPTSAISFSTNGLTSAISPPVWTAESCTWTDFSTWTGCLDNVFHDLFSPSSESLNQYQGLYAQFINKPPFGYIVAIQSALAGINDTNTSVFTLQSMPLLNTMIFDPIRTALIWVLWVAFAFVLYHRLKNIAI